MPWRLMTSQDLEPVRILADRVHVDHQEDIGVFVERQGIYPQGCHALVEGGRIIGYALAHPWRFGEPPPLNSRLGEIPRVATTYYIHDVALLPEARGRGYAAQAARLLEDDARRAGLGNMSLVAVNDSQGFWQGLGFRAQAMPGLDRKLFSYGSDAVLMRRDLIRTTG
jgi:GNAT superfamily N-acetyltransferase